MERTSNSHTATENSNERSSKENAATFSPPPSLGEQQSAFLHNKPAALSHQSEEQLLEIFWGEEGREYYFKRWALGRPTWNWAAFFFSIWWLGCRRMYIPLLAILGGFLFLRIVPAQLGLDFNKIDGIVRLAVIISLGIAGNSLYHRHALKTIEQYKSKYPEQAVLEERLARKGGVSFDGFLIATAIIITYIIILVIL